VDAGLECAWPRLLAETAPCPMEFGHPRYLCRIGPADELLDKYGLVARDVAAAVRKVVARKR